MLQYLLIFFAAFAGSVHCVGMCGGFACALGRDARGAATTLRRHLIYNLGRATTYCFLGAVVGYLGLLLVGHHGQGTPVSLAQRALALVSGGLIVYAGLQFFGFSRGRWEHGPAAQFMTSGLRGLLGSPSAARRSLRRAQRVLALPLVYAFAAQAAASGGALPGVLTMAALSLGTFPAMLPMGGAGLGCVLTPPRRRRASGAREAARRRWRCRLLLRPGLAALCVGPICTPTLSRRAGEGPLWGSGMQSLSAADRALAQQREVNGEHGVFCCYGCCLAYQVHHGEKEEPEAASLLIRLGVGAFLAMNIMLFSLLLYSGTFGAADGWMVNVVHWLLWILATPLVVVLGGPFVRGAWQSALQRRVTTDTLVAIGALAAYGYSAVQVVLGSGEVYFDTATMVLVLFVLGRYLEAQGRVRAMRSLAPMLAAERAQARVFADGSDTLRPVGQVQPGNLVRILPGERIPVDGLIIEGRSDCDESILTGQPQPQPKAPGAAVHAGSLNGRGQLLVRATAAGGATRWVQISRLVREALAQKSSLANTVDRLAAVFVPAVIVLALATVWFWSAREPFGQALLTGLAVLVVACPCSLGLAAPLATTLGIALAAQRGILIRSGRALERLARVRAIAFDKTGLGGLAGRQLHAHRPRRQVLH